MLNPINAILFTIIVVAVLDYYKHVVGNDAMLRALRRENVQLVHKNMALEEQNLALIKKNEAIEAKLNKVESMHTLQDEHTADVIAKLQAEIRMKDKMLEQKWKTARAVCEVVNG